jgi:hypothetical protein
MVELSCSSGEFPIHKVAFDPADVAGGAVRFRLPELYRNEWGVRARRVPWWWIGPEVRPQEVTGHAAARIGREGQLKSSPDLQIPIAEALRDVEPQVDDAISRIERFGIPFFRDFTEKRLPS